MRLFLGLSLDQGGLGTWIAARRESTAEYLIGGEHRDKRSRKVVGR